MKLNEALFAISELGARPGNNGKLIRLLVFHQSDCPKVRGSVCICDANYNVKVEDRLPDTIREDLKLGVGPRPGDVRVRSQENATKT